MPPPTSAPPAVSRFAPRSAMANGWRNVGVFLVTLTLVQGALEAVLPMPNVGEVSEKLTYFARHKAEFDAVFVGSSRVSAQISPTVFDQEVTAATGRPMHSFNLGAPSMFLPESLYVIDRILAQRSARLRWMFIELDDPKPRVEEHAGLVRREVYWHALPETALMSFNILAARGLHKRDRVAMLAHQWALFGRRWSHLDRAREWLMRGFAPAVADADETAALGPATDGYQPYQATLGEGKGMRRDVETFTAAAAALTAARRRAVPGPGASVPLRWLLAGKIRALRARNVEPVFVIAPVTTGEDEFLRLSADGALRPLLAFNDPAAYPELYEVSARADTMHLNARGAQQFTRLLARRFAESRAAQPAPLTP